MTQNRILSSLNNQPEPNKNNNNGKNSRQSGKKTSFGWRLLRFLGSLFLISAFLLISFYFMVRQGMFGELPNYADLRAIKTPTASTIYANEGQVLGRFYYQNRQIISYNDIPAFVIQALVATEDARFYQHQGVDARSLFRVLIRSILLGDESGGGGSTIGQQLIKSLYPRQSYGLLTLPVVKMKEAIIARRLSNIYTKDEILALYLNTVSFGEDVYGIAAASQRYFSVAPKDLRVEEGAVLVGMLKATTTFNPRLNPDKSLSRRNVVLDQMVRYNYLNPTQAESLKAKPIEVKYKRRSASEAVAAHLRDRVREQVKKWLDEHPKPDGSKYNLFADGLKIYTTIDANLQEYAQQAVAKHMKTLQADFEKHWGKNRPWTNATDILDAAIKRSNRYKALADAGANRTEIDKAFKTPVKMNVFSYGDEITKTMTPLDSVAYHLMFLNAGFEAIDPQTGFVKAYVGSIDHEYFPFDHVQAHRQVGSTFKPVVYATAIEQGIQPCKYYANELITYADYQNWTPQNADGEYGGFYSMAGAMAQSMNTVSVQVLFDAGLNNVINYAKRLGVTSTLPQMPSIALGAADLNLYEMTRTYAALANGGYNVEPVFLMRIEDKNGKSIADFSKNYPRREIALAKETSQAITKMLQAVVDSGTAKRLRTKYGFTFDIAGKTGTTQDHSDGWFIGYTPKLVAGAWVGGTDRRIRFNTVSLGQGANMALPIWAEFMAAAKKNPKTAYFTSGSFTISDDILLELTCPNMVTDTSTYYNYSEGGGTDNFPNIETETDADGNVIIIPPSNTTTSPQSKPGSGTKGRTLPSQQTTPNTQNSPAGKTKPKQPAQEPDKKKKWWEIF